MSDDGKMEKKKLIKSSSGVSFKLETKINLFNHSREADQ